MIKQVPYTVESWAEYDEDGDCRFCARSRWTLGQKIFFAHSTSGHLTEQSAIAAIHVAEARDESDRAA